MNVAACHAVVGFEMNIRLIFIGRLLGAGFVP